MSTSITNTLYYLPHPLETRFHAVKTYRLGYSVSFVIRRYKISKASLMRWNRRFDGSRESLMDRSHRPKSPHPTAHTEVETLYSEALRYLKSPWSEVATRCKIRSQSLLRRENAGSILSIHRHR